MAVGSGYPRNAFPSLTVLVSRRRRCPEALTASPEGVLRFATERKGTVRLTPVE